MTRDVILLVAKQELLGQHEKLELRHEKKEKAEGKKLQGLCFAWAEPYRRLYPSHKTQYFIDFITLFRFLPLLSSFGCPLPSDLCLLPFLLRLTQHLLLCLSELLAGVIPDFPGREAEGDFSAAGVGFDPIFLYQQIHFFKGKGH